MKIKLNLTPWLFLAPALIYFTIMVIYPIIGSVHISFHDWNGTQFKCSDGRDIKSLQENEFCRKIPDMKYIGFENYQRFFKKTPKDFNKIKKYWQKVFDPGDNKIGVPVLDQGIGLISTLTDGKKTKWPRLSIETKIILNTLKWLIFFP